MTSESPLVRRLLWNLVPFAVVVGAVATTLIGEEGLLNRSVLKQRLFAMEQRVEDVNLENDRLRSQVRALQDDPRVVRRVAAEQLLVAPPGSTIYRFEAEPTGGARTN